MNFSALIASITNAMTNGQLSSVFSRFVGASGIYGAFHNVGNFLTGILYNVAKYLLYFVDLIYSYIQKLCGLDMSLESLDAMISEESDIVFNLLISGRELVTMIIRNLLVLAIVVIIVFAIVAIIKGQYDAVKKGQETSPGQVIKTTFKAFILLLITPFIAIGGIIFSDLVLQTLYRATDVSGAASLGTQVYLAASTSANAYRVYAQNNQRIPITFDGSKNAQISSYFDSHEVTEGFVKYLQESKNAGNAYNPIYATYMSFMTSDYTRFNDMNTIISPQNTAIKETKALYDSFYDYYVLANNYDPYRTYSGLRKIDCYAEYYYVMADVVDFCIQTASPVYFKTIEQVLDSIYQLPDSVDKDTIFDLMVKQYGIGFYMDYDSDLGAPINPIETANVQINTAQAYHDYKGVFNIIAFNSDYLAPSDSGDPEIRMQIPVGHVVGMTDEILGAKFIVANQKAVIGSDGVTSYYFEPFVNGTKIIGDNEFKSDYIRNGNIIMAKGIFQDSIYPTAIRIKKGQTQSGQTVDNLEFYREDISAQAEGQMSDYMSFHVDSPGGLFGKLFKFISALFNPASLVPKLDVNFDAMVLDYVKGDTSTPVDTLVDARMRIGYFMPSSPQRTSPSIVKNMGLSFTGLYVASKVNFLLLVVGSILLLKVSFSAITSLIERAYELFLIFLTYPAVCATIPIDDGRAYNTWLKGYMSRIFRTYGFILGINFVLMLFPIITKIEYFTQDEIGTSKIIRRIGTLFFSVMTVRQITNLMNMAVAVIFELAAFTLIEAIPEVVSTMVSGPESALKVKDNSVFTKIKNTAVKVTSAATKIMMPPLHALQYVFAKKEKKKAMRKALKQNMLNKVGLGAFNNPERFIPFSAVASDMKYKQQQRENKAQQKAAYEELNKTLDDPMASKEQVKKAATQFMGQQHSSASQVRKKIKCQNGHVFSSEGQLQAEVRDVERNVSGKIPHPDRFNPKCCPRCFVESGEESLNIPILSDAKKEDSKEGENK